MATGDFWLHAAHHLSPQGPEDRKDVLKHVVTFYLEPEVYLAFAALRLVLVHEDVRPVLLRELPSRATANRGRSSGDTLGPVLTFALVLSSVGHRLKPLWESYDLRDFGYNHPLQIIFDRIYPLSAEDRHGLTVTFEDAGVPAKSISSTRPQDFLAGYRQSPQLVRSFCNIHYSFCLLPTRPHKRSIPSLPSSIVRLIAKGVCDEGLDPISCARNLLYFTLVSKEWRRCDIFGLLWTSPAWSGYELSLPEYRALARFIGENTFIARKMETFPRKGWYTGNPNLDWRGLSDLILKVATNLESITLHDYEFEYSHSRLADLKRVKIFRLLLGSSAVPWYSPALLENVLGSIHSWSLLEELVVDDFITAGSAISQIHGQSADYQLRRLCLTNGIIRSAHLQHLTSHPTQVLEHLVFNNLINLTNSNLLQLFSIVAGTLLSLSIENCNTYPPTPQEKGFAFDLTVGRMIKLKYASLEWQLVSSKAISEKRLLEPDAQLSGTLRILDPNARILSQSTDPAGVGLVHAIKHSGWRCIDLAGSPPSSLSSELGEAVAIATSRGIIITI